MFIYLVYKIRTRLAIKVKKGNVLPRTDHEDTEGGG